MAFSLTRFLYLFKLQWAENKKSYLYGLLALVGIMAAVLFNVSERNVQGGVFFAGLFSSAFIFTSSLLSRFANKTQAISALMLPVSALEKTAVAVIYSMIIFPLLYVVLIYPLVLLAYYYHWIVKGDLCLLYSYNTLNNTGVLVLLFFISQAFTLYCSVVFSRFIMVKTAVLACLIYFGVFLLNQEVSTLLFKDVNPTVLPKGYTSRPPETVTISNFKHIGASNNPIRSAHDSLLNTGTKTVAIPQFEIGPSTPYGTQYFLSANRKRNTLRWTVEQTVTVQHCFFAFHFMLIPLFCWLTFLRLKEKFLA